MDRSGFRNCGLPDSTVDSPGAGWLAFVDHSAGLQESVLLLRSCVTLMLSAWVLLVGRLRGSLWCRNWGLSHDDAGNCWSVSFVGHSDDLLELRHAMSSARVLLRVYWPRRSCRR